ncbi:transketolase [Propionibacteriaceae bacterium Y1923]
MTTPDTQQLQVHAARARRNVLRMLEANPNGHLGGAMSAIDMITAIYFHAMRPSSGVDDPGRDRFLLSAGHKAMGQYAVLAEKGIIDESVLDQYGALSSPVPGHPNMSLLQGIEANTGALGHGLPIACGMALGLRREHPDARIYVMMGDGELPEGSNWEGAAIAAHYCLDNIVAFVDLNGMQISGTTEEVMNMNSVVEKFRAFGWSVSEIDGHDMAQITAALDSAPTEPGKPTVFVAHTIKGKGVSSIQGTVPSHYWKPKADELAEAVAESEALIKTLEDAR